MCEGKSTLDLSLYKKMRKIGEGAFGKVFKVKEKSSGIIFAAKISSIKYKKNDKSQIDNIDREINIMAKLEHPSILKFIGYSDVNFSNKSHPVIITEYIPNGSLKDVIDLERQSIFLKSWNNTKKLINIFGIASVMAFLHSHGIIHRDLKPANILEDDYLFPKIADFGLSKRYHENIESILENDQSLKGLKGTPKYMSPESLGEYEYTKASDVYSFAIIVYEMMTLEEPYSNCVIGVLMKIICLDKKRPKFKVPIPDCYKNLIERCWEDKPEERPTFEEIVNELKFNTKFITNDINRTEYYNYIKFIENSQNSFNLSQKFEKVAISKTHKKKNEKKEWKAFEENNFNTENQAQSNIPLIKSEKQSQLIYKLGEINKEDIENIPGIQIRQRSEFEIIPKVIGKGEFGFVRLAIDKLNGQKIAFKEIYPSIDGQEEFQICREIKILATIDHCAIQKIYGYIKENIIGLKPSIILTHFQENDCLDKFIQNKYETLDFTQKFIIMYGIAAGLNYLHEKDIIHGKLNPKSILINKEMEPIITNFTQSKFIESDEIFQSLVIGEPIYTAPELFEMEKEGFISSYKEKSFDVYNFSLIAYYIFTGQRPWHDVKQIMLLPAKIVSGDRPNFPSNLPKILILLIKACWDQETVNRPSFSIILEIISDKQFIEKLGDNIDMDRFKKYQDKVLSDKSFSSDNYQKDNFINGVIFPKIPANKFYFHYDHSYELCNNDFFEIYESKSNNQPDDVYNIYKIKKEYSKNKDILDLFSSQIQVLLTVDHPVLSKLYGCNSIPSKFFSTDIEYTSLYNYFPKYKSLPEIIVSSTKGGNLSTNIRNLNITEKFIILYGIVSGMNYLHEKNIVHLNLKPENILLNNEFEPIIKIDITSKFLGKELDLLTILSEFSFAYVSPELFDLNNNENDELLKSCDVYSFAMICYYLLSGNTPWDSNVDIQLNLLKVKNGERPNIKRIISYPFNTLIEDCWNKDPYKRPTFNEIFSRIGSPLFVKSILNIDFNKFLKYQKTIKEEFIQPKQQLQLRFKSEFDISKEIFYDDFSVTKIAKDKTNNQLVLYKSITDKNCRFIERAQFFSNINFPSIIKPYYLIKPKRGKEYGIIILPYPSNGDLDSVIRDKILDYTQKCIILYGIAIGMLKLHDQGISHKSLFPRNILFDKELEPWISGIITPHSSDDKELLYSTSSYSEIPYISPEILSMKPNKTIEYNQQLSDVYSFGMIAYYLLTEKKPYENIKKPSRIIQKVTNHGERPKFPKDIEQTLINLISRCWDNSPERRPTFKQICSVICNPNIYTNQDYQFDRKRFYEYQLKIGELSFIKFGQLEIEKFEKESLYNSFRNAVNLRGIEKDKLVECIENMNYFHKALTELDSNNKSLVIPANKTEDLFKNELFKSNDFNDILNTYEKISIEINYPSNSFIPFIKSISNIIEKNIDKVNVVIFIIDVSTIIRIPKLDYPPFSIVIQPPVISIGSNAFKDCKSLKQIEIISSVTKIGLSAFEGCSSLTQIKLPSSIIKIGENAFYSN